jgi:hypothetical protein
MLGIFRDRGKEDDWSASTLCAVIVMDGSEEEKISSVQPCMCPILIFGDFVHLVV